LWLAIALHVPYSLVRALRLRYALDPLVAEASEGARTRVAPSLLYGSGWVSFAMILLLPLRLGELSRPLLLVGPKVPGLGLPGVPAGAFVGALLAMVLVLQIAKRASRGGMDTRILILSGVIAGAFFNAVILLLLSIADVESFRSAVFWMMGNLSGADWAANALLAALLLPAAIALLSLARSFNLLSRGEEVAFHLGTSVSRVKLTAYVAASLMVAAAVAAGGVIGFVGLIVPHAVRLAWGNDHRMLLPASFMAGAAFLLLADTGARVVLAPAELPTGVVTAIAGVPFFLALLVRRGSA
ncbi:MAG: iron ABC transporter permease, partial [Gemmatimonadota bacterium]